MRIWKISVIAAVALCFGSAIGFNVFKEYKIAEALANRKPAINPVSVVLVKKTQWQPTITAIGFIEPQQGLDVTNETSGRITSINFSSGSRVDKDVTLVQLNDAVEQANLQSTKAKYESAYKNFLRIEKLVKQGNASQKDLDEATAQYESYKADIESIKAQIAKLNIKTPFAGVLGIRNVYQGQYLQTGTSIVHLEDTSNMKLRFTVSQNEYAKISLGQEVVIHVDTYPNEQFKGSITATEAVINKGAGVIEIQATIPNSNQKLLTGMYAHVEVILPTIPDQIVIPQTAIAFNLYGETVYVVKDSTDNFDENGKPIKMVKQINVTISERRDDVALITAGLQEGDTIVTEGQVRLSNNSLVSINDEYKLNKPEQLPKL